MISALHLLWIIPLSGMFGFFMTVLCVAAGSNSQGEKINEK